VITVARRVRRDPMPVFAGSYTGRLVLATESAEDTEARLSAFTELAATAISKADANDELRQLAEEQAALRRVATLVAEVAPPDEIFAAVVDEVGTILGLQGIELVRYEGLDRFDVLPLSVLTAGAIEVLGVDYRRLRPNVLLGGVAGLTERDWVGRRIRIGSALVAFAQLRPRCVMTTFDPDTLEQDHGVLRQIVREYDGTFALDAFVVEPGRVRVGDPVTLEG